MREYVTDGATLHSDAHFSYQGLSRDYVHNVTDHAEAYVDGEVHTNGMENFWSLLRRAIKGTYVSIEPFHLFRYLDEQSFRFNHRAVDDAARFCAGPEGHHRQAPDLFRLDRLGVATNVLKKGSRNSSADVPDVPADNPVGTMRRFMTGLERVLAAPKRIGARQIDTASAPSERGGIGARPNRRNRGIRRKNRS